MKQESRGLLAHLLLAGVVKLTHIGHSDWIKRVIILEKVI